MATIVLTDTERAVRRRAYLDAATNRLAEKRRRLDCISRRMLTAVDEGRIAPSDQLRRAGQRAERQCEIAQTAIDRLCRTGDAAWPDCEEDFERAMDDLATSIRRIVARLY